MRHRTLESGLEVEVLGRCTGSFCPEVATLAVTMKPYAGDNGRKHPTYGKCTKHVETEYVSAGEYEKQQAEYGRSSFARFCYNRDHYEIRPLTDQEAAEVAYEQDAPKRWKAEGTVGAVRRIFELHQAEEIDGVLVDGFSASIVIAVYDGVNEENKAKLAAMPIGVMCAFALKVYNNAQKR